MTVCSITECMLSCLVSFHQALTTFIDCTGWFIAILVSAEFIQQARHFISNLHIFKLQPMVQAGKAQAGGASVIDSGLSGSTAVSSSSGAAAGNTGASHAGAVQSRRVKDFAALVNFLAHASSVYKEEMMTLKIPQEIFTLLYQHCETLDPFLRRTVVQALIQMQNRGILPRQELLPALFRTFRCPDKDLRRMVFQHLVSDLHKLCTRQTGHKTISALQKIVYNTLRDDNAAVALKALQLLVELWRRNVWVEARTVNSIATMCFTQDDKLVCAALYYFCGDYDMANEEAANEHSENVRRQKEVATIVAHMKHVKRRLKRVREVERAKKAMKRSEAKLNQNDDDNDEAVAVTKSANMDPLALIYDAQHFAERLFARLKTSRESFTTRLLTMNCISKLIGLHRLLLFNFYPFVQRFLQPKQRSVTQILVYLARATHSLVPPEVLQPVIKTLATHFVTDRSTPEVIALGIGAIREICSRAPLVMTQELLQDLTQYAKHKNKGIMTAARSLIQVFRQLNPSLLHRRDRGKEATERMLLMEGPGLDAERERALSASRLEVSLTLNPLVTHYL